MNQSRKPSCTVHRTPAIKLALVSCMLLILPSCGIPGLRSAQPGPTTPESFNGLATPDNSADLRVEEFFDDPILLNLIEQGLNGNQELKILAQDIWMASNRVLARRGAYLPFLSIGAGAGIDKPSLYTRQGAGRQPAQHRAVPAVPQPLARLPVRRQPLLADRHLEAVAQPPRRRLLAIPRHRRGPELRRHPAGRRDRRELLPPDRARQADREPRPHHRAPAGEPPGRQGQEGGRPGHRAGRAEVHRRGGAEPVREADHQPADHRDREPDQLPRRPLPDARRAGTRRATSSS